MCKLYYVFLEKKRSLSSKFCLREMEETGTGIKHDIKFISQFRQAELTVFVLRESTVKRADFYQS